MENRTLNSSEEIDFALTSAELHLALNEPMLAELFLQDVAKLTACASNAQTLCYSQLRARWYEANAQVFEAARIRLMHASYLSHHGDVLNHELIWRDLLSLDEV